MAQHFKPKMAGLMALVIALIIGVTTAATAHRRSTEKARLLADINRVEMPAAAYAMEIAPARRTSDDTAWRLYCERERVALIADARAAAAPR